MNAKKRSSAKCDLVFVLDFCALLPARFSLNTFSVAQHARTAAMSQQKKFSNVKGKPGTTRDDENECIPSSIHSAADDTSHNAARAHSLARAADRRPEADDDDKDTARDKHV